MRSLPLSNIVVANSRYLALRLKMRQVLVLKANAPMFVAMPGTGRTGFTHGIFAPYYPLYTTSHACDRRDR